MCIFRALLKMRDIDSEGPGKIPVLVEYKPKPASKPRTKEDEYRDYLELANDEFNYGHNVPHPYVPSDCIAEYEED